MKNANIRLGLGCNMDCLFCTIADDNSLEMSTIQVKEKIVQLKNSGIDTLTLTGGEPTLRKDLPEIIKYAKVSGIKNIDLQTNAVLLSDEKHVLKLKKAGLNYITLGISSHIKEKYNHLTNSGCYEKALLGIRNILKHGINISVYHVINSENYMDIIDFIDFMQSLSKKIRFAFAFLRPNGNTKSNKFLVPKLREIEYYIFEMFNYLEKKKIENVLLEGVPLCYMCGFEDKSAETWRMMKPSVPYISENNIKHESLHSDINKYLKKKSAICNICSLNGKCAGVWTEYAEIHGLKELYPIFMKEEIRW